jgi:hypothetical protein
VCFIEDPVCCQEHLYVKWVTDKTTVNICDGSATGTSFQK